ncbi:MOSC domain-containing protein [Limnoraphis robusta]|uniref:Sulfurase n=1 Tax=Limnoraphis robusta CS-951 TaxID=1637645 RepID=A0A0F5YC93_9CYAN|nr:MOSC domain-containing protein [Limnoraphis robusta]KKD35850.1 sulfurase [Limnoraphis robusta CS-951]
MLIPQLDSIQVGLPQQIGIEEATDPMDRPWSTGFFKESVQGLIWLGKTHLVGDGQADLKNHGGVDKAVLGYAADHYPWWKNCLNKINFPYGAFGENFTISGQTETSVCIGDVYQVGEAEIQVSQPRKPCWKLSRRWRIEDLALQVQKTGRTGWYFRVLKEGFVEPGLPLILSDRPFSEWTVAQANDIMYNRCCDSYVKSQLATCPLLSANWQEKLLNSLY